MGTATITLMIITLISKLTGLIREQVFAYYLGTGMAHDIYITSLNIPVTIFSFITASVIAGFIPIYHKIDTEKGEEEANLFTSNLINILLIVATVVIFIIFIITPSLVTLFASGYEGVKREITIIFTRVLSFSLYGIVLSSVFIGFLQIKNKFLIAESPGIVMNFFYITTIIVAAYFDNIYIIAIGIFLSEYLKYLLFPREIRKAGYKHTWYINFKDEYIQDLLKITIPIIISIAAVDVSTISDQTFASQLIEHGGVTIMRNSALLLSLISGIIVVSITTVIYPIISKQASLGHISEVKKTLMDGNIFSFILIVPAMVGVMILSEPLVKLIFERGSFTVESTKLTSGVLFFYIPTLLGQTINQIFTRGFYSLQNTKIPIAITLVQVALNIFLNYILSGIMGLNGLALATTISTTIGGIASLVFFRWKYGQMHLKIFITSVIKVMIASSIMGIVTYFSYNYFAQYNYLIGLLISIILSIIVYLIVIVMLKVDHLKQIINMLYKKFKNK